MSLLWRGLTLLTMALAAGCALAPPGPAVPPAVGTAFLGGDPRPLSPQELDQRLSQVQVLIVGETHDHPGDHQVQLDLLKSMDRQGGPLVVGVEWLDHTAQPACDQLSAGQVSVEEFARLADWEDKWGFPLKLYAPILSYVRERRLRLVALNAPLEAVRQVAKGGLASLDARQRGLLAPALDLADPAYRQQVAEQFKMHGVAGQLQQENFFAAQVARDDTMAHHLAQALLPWPDSGKRAVVLAGGGHLAHGLGLPTRLQRRLPGVNLLTALPVPAEMAAALTKGAAGDWPADLLVVTTPPPPQPPRLGVVLKAEEQGLRVERVWPGSPAEQAGVKVGDLLTGVDGSPLRSSKEIHNLVKTAPFAPHRYQVKRGEQQLEITITLGAGGR